MEQSGDGDGDGGAFAAVEPTAVSLAGVAVAPEKTIQTNRKKQTAHQTETITLTGGDSAGDCGAVAAVIRGKRKGPK